MVRNAARRMAQQIAARFDAAQTRDDDRRYWSLVDSLSADAALSPSVRKIIRNRARYESGNGGYCNGMIKQRANNLIGTGPHLQMLTEDEDTNAALEADWQLWSRKTQFARTLRTATRCRLRDGAALGLIRNNSKLQTRSTVQLRLIDIDRLSSPLKLINQPNHVDGIDFDADGNPDGYWILDVHPGSNQLGAGSLNSTRYPAANVIHWFDEDRAEQHHGLSELAPTLRRFGDHRRWLTANVRAAELAALIALFMTTQEADDDEADDYVRKALEVLDVDYAGIMVAPAGNDIKSVRSEHPNVVFEQFNDAMVAEESRPLLISSNEAAGNFNKASYASSRAETQTTDGNNAIERDDLEIIVVEPVFDPWLREDLSAICGIAPSDIDISEYPHEWHWDQHGHVDPEKESNSQDSDLKNGSLSHPTLYARQGKDWRKEFKKQADALGVSFDEFQTMVRKKLFELKQSEKPKGAKNGKEVATAE